MNYVVSPNETDDASLIEHFWRGESPVREVKEIHFLAIRTMSGRLFHRCDSYA
ncbi:uncharacterized protein BJ212DRAFT_1349953 [Suillus subaureus]|uniref:Uncharacterized protein n=1 Tax=Suillus subaureus TaxID=48587 RepID=A0A9P7JEH2_9AGAM|nr:uncharacterized protein BJ212DRAFT_1349953 [Suillus subaureus]KAG1817657.1 hypothetical protein BJ212DRAFT_1349953 [Suillus subaureus]